MKHKLWVNVGRWSGGPPVEVNDLNENTIFGLCVKKIKEFEHPELMGTQVLVWCDQGSVHNLIAVCDFTVGYRMTML